MGVAVLALGSLSGERMLAVEKRQVLSSPYLCLSVSICVYLCPSVVELNRYSYGVVPLRFSLSFCQAESDRAKCSRASPPIP